MKKKFLSLFLILVMIVSIVPLNAIDVSASTVADSIISIAESQKGCYGSDNNKFTKWFYGKSYSAQWCAIFVCWCADQVGVLNESIPKYAVCATMKNWFVNQGRYHSIDSGYSPQKGDIVFFSTDGTSTPHHVGFIAKSGISDGKIYYIDGNTSDDSVKERYMSISYSSCKTLGFANPNYGENPTCTCSTDYAGTYTTKDVSTNLNIRPNHDLSGTQIGKIPSGSTFYVSKADGKCAHVEYNGISGYVSFAYIQRCQEPEYAQFDVNFRLDGTDDNCSCGNYGTFDVYINGSLVADDVTDFCENYPKGTGYEIKDIKTKSGKRYDGTCTGSLSGTINSSFEVRLVFSTSSDPGTDDVHFDAITGSGFSLYFNFANCSQVVIEISTENGTIIGSLTSQNGSVYNFERTDSSWGNKFKVDLIPDGDRSRIHHVNGEGNYVTLSDTAPTGYVDYVVGGEQKITVGGWAYDADNTDAQLSIHIYSGTTMLAATVANGERNDVNDAFGCGSYHGFTCSFDTTQTGNIPITIYVIGVDNLGNPNGVNTPICIDEVAVVTKHTTHTWDFGVVTKAATCATEGVKTFTCTVCNQTKTETIERKTTHTWDSGVITKAATCTADGVRTYTCTVCKNTKTSVISALGHSYTCKNQTSTYLKSSATCTSAAVYYYKCSRCTAKGTNTYTYGSALGHSYTYKNPTSTYLKSSATCTSAAVYYYKCSRCTAKGTNTYTYGSALGHSYTCKNPTSTYLKSSATCTYAAVYYYKCSRCTAKGTNTYTYGSALGHSYSTKWSNNSTYHWHTCTRCGTALSGKATHVYDNSSDLTCNVCNYQRNRTHTWNSGTVTKAATCKKEGTKIYTCSDCGATKTETIPPLGHNLEYHPYTPATCTKDGNYPYYQCTRCKNLYINADGTHYTTIEEQTIPKAHKLYKIAAKSATCTTKGNITYYKCSACSKRFLDSDAKQETTLSAVTIKAKSHYWSSPKVTKKATCATTGVKTYTCTRAGCSATKTASIPKTNTHTVVKTKGVAPTCTENGFWTYYTCTVCGKVFSDAAATRKVTVAGQMRNATGHSLTKVAYKAATATTNGNKTYYKCSKCSKLFLDSAGTKATTLSAVTIKATGK